LGLFPGLSLRSNPGLKLANAFGVIQLLHYLFGVIQLLFYLFGVIQLLHYLFGVISN
jgi:hypothetical protein